MKMEQSLINLKDLGLTELTREVQNETIAGVEMAEVAVTMVGIAIAGAGAVKALGSKITTVSSNTGAEL
jgi:hypothetical protein